MKTVKTLGLVLKGSNFGEADKILTVFTLSLGKVKVMAKGIRKIRAHLCGSLEPFMLVDLQLYPGKTFYLVTGASIKDEFKKVRCDLDKAAKAFYLGELVDRFIEEGIKNEEIFNLFVKALFEVEKGLPGPVIQAFELKLIEASGFKPELYVCTVCKEKILPDDNIWSNEAGGLVCPSCRKGYSGLNITKEAIKFFRFVERGSSDEISRLNVSSQVEVEAEEILSSYIESILERELKSKKFLKSIKDQR